MTNINSGFVTDLIALWLGDIADGDVPALGHQLRPAARDVILDFVNLCNQEWFKNEEYMKVIFEQLRNQETFGNRGSH